MISGLKNFLFGNLPNDASKYYDGTGAFSVPAGGGGGGGLVLLNTQIAAASATLEFVSIISSSYNIYKFVFENVLPGTNNQDFEFYLSDDNGATWIAGDYYYSWLYSNNLGGSGIQAAGPVNRGLILNSANQGSNDGVNGNLELYNPLGAQTRKTVTYQTTSPLPSDHRHFNGGCTNVNAASANPIDAIKFQFATGVITSGSIYCFGYKK